jgi:hypothetical protein
MKNRREMIKSLVFVVLALVFALSFISQVEAREIRGKYAIVGEATCVTHWLVNPNNPTNPSATPYYTLTSSVQGTTTFNGNGTGSVQASLVQILHPIYTPIPLGPYWLEPSWPFSLPPNIIGGNTETSDISFRFTYTVAPNGHVTRAVIPGTVTGTFTSGPFAGKTFTFTPFTLTGFVSIFNETILLSSVPGQPEILTTDIFNSDGSLFGRNEQECHRSRVLTLIGF